MKPPSKLELFEELMLPHLNAAYNLARWLARNEHDAEDIVQEAYLRAFRFFDSFRGDDGKSWLLAIVRNTFRTWHGGTQRIHTVAFDEELHGSGGAESVEFGVVQASTFEKVRECLETLPALYREALVMRELEEMPYQEIAEATRSPIGTVMSRLARARRRLMDCVAVRLKGVPHDV